MLNKVSCYYYHLFISGQARFRPSLPDSCELIQPCLSGCFVQPPTLLERAVKRTRSVPNSETTTQRCDSSSIILNNMGFFPIISKGSLLPHQIMSSKVTLSERIKISRNLVLFSASDQIILKRQRVNGGL